MPHTSPSETPPVLSVLAQLAKMESVRFLEIDRSPRPTQFTSICQVMFLLPIHTAFACQPAACCCLTSPAASRAGRFPRPQPSLLVYGWLSKVPPIYTACVPQPASPVWARQQHLVQVGLHAVDPVHQRGGVALLEVAPDARLPAWEDARGRARLRAWFTETQT